MVDIEDGIGAKKHDGLKVIIVGCGLGGLACAISCRREGLDVIILEKASALSEIGAGIQLPPNATRIMAKWDMMEKLYAAGCSAKGNNYILRWQNGSHIGTRPDDKWAETKFGYAWHTMHRADYQRVLADEARRLGADIRLGQDVVSVGCHDKDPVIHFGDGSTMIADLVVGADGLRSVIRTSVLGHVKEPEESGDLAYRITIPREELLEETDTFIRSIVEEQTNAIWWGQNMHVVMYGVRGNELVNLVLVCPDDLPPDVSKQSGELAEMHKLFEGWDPRLRILLGKVHKALKWKIYSMAELDEWVKGSVALLGDACHPSVPYAASGAAMAVEDGAVLGRLLGHFVGAGRPKSSLPKLLRLYWDIRKQRTTTGVKTADGNRKLYHMVDGREQQERDTFLHGHDWWDESKTSPYVFADIGYLHQMFGFDALESANEGFEASDLALVS